jgi:antitoxin component of MazEF toxin-antitoxin module
MPTTVKAKKWGSSIALLIPRNFAKSREIDVGTVVDIDPLRVVRPARRRRYKLSELMTKYKPKHRHGEWDLGTPVGKEIW